MMIDNQTFTILDAVESTNNYAMAKAHAGLAVHGQAWFARDQWGGKGQRGNMWVSAKDENIIMTIILKPDKLFRTNMFLFNAVVACTCHQFSSKISGQTTYIKWPNDIYFNDRKAGGILIENIFSDKEWIWAAVGIGFNVNQIDFGPGNENAISLKNVCSQIFNPIELAKKLHKLILVNFKALSNVGEDFYFNYYNKQLYKKNETVKMKKGNIIFSTCIKEVNRQGQLITYDAFERQFNSGEIKWLL